MLTPNTIVKYVINFYNLAEHGPLVLEMPGGRLVGIMMDYQMRWVADLGLVSTSGTPSRNDRVYRAQSVATGRGIGERLASRTSGHERRLLGCSGSEAGR